MSARTRILAVDLRRDEDVVLARQRARQIARLLGMDGQDQVRTATAVSEIARNAMRYAGHGRVEFLVDPGPPAPGLVVRVTDQGPGIRDLADVLAGRYRSRTGLGLGLLGTQRLMDDVQVSSKVGAGTEVTLTKHLPPRARDARTLASLGEELAREAPADVTDEMRAVNQELLRALDEVRRRHDDLLRLNRELEDTNRGVVALYAELDEKAESLRRADQMKSRFLSHMSHEFRTPLNSILALAALLEQRVDGELSPEQEKQVGYIRRSAQDLTELVNDLLDLAKVEAGKTEVRAASFGLGRLFGALRGLMRPLQVSEAVQLVFEDAAGIPEIYTDEGKLGQIVRNLVSNALKFTDQGEVRVAARTAEDDRVAISVADTGIGIAPDDQDRIFQEFGQVDGPVQRRVKGTGLGLALSRKLAELLGGTLTVWSAVGRGSTFTVTIPRVYVEPRNLAEPPATAAVPPEPAPPAAYPAARPRALIIDDEETARYTLASRLVEISFDVAEAGDPKQGLRLAHDLHPDAVFLDLVMPDMMGFEVLERLREDPATRALPVVVVTSKMLGPEEESRLAAQGAALLSKEECTRPDAAARIREALARAGWPATVSAGTEAVARR